MMRIVRIDDDIRGKRISDMFFKTGLKADGIRYESYDDWDPIMKDLESGDLAYAYILDNEIAGAGIEGGKWLKISMIKQDNYKMREGWIIQSWLLHCFVQPRKKFKKFMDLN